MEEILELQKKLADIQSSSNLNKLSDRIIVDLIERLLKTTEFRLIFTLDGQEYLTPEYLDTQIYEIIQMKNRVSVVDIPQLLNVGYEKIEPRLDSVCCKFSEIYRLDDFLFTGFYIDSICEEINEELQQHMHIPLIDLSSKYTFPIDYIKSIVEKKVGSIIQGVISGDKLTTLSYIQTMQSKLKGVLRASIRPVALSSLIKDYDIEEIELTEKIEELIKKEEIEGKVQGGMFIPSRFIKNQELIVKNFFKQNDYIEYSLMMKQLMIPRPKDFLKALFKDSCIFLDNCCFNKDSLGAVKEQVLSFLDFGWVDLQAQSILPSILKDEEIEAIISKHLELNDTTEIDGTIIFSKEFLEKCAMAFKEKIIEFIYKTPQKLVENKESNLKSTNSKSQSKKSKKNIPFEDTETKESSSEKIFSREEVIKLLIEKKIIEETDKDDYFEEKLYKVLMGKIANLYENIKKDLFETKKAGSLEVIQDLQKKIEDLIMALQFDLKSVQMIEKNYTNISVGMFYESLNQSSIFLVENILILLCKKYSVTLPQTLFNASSSDKINFESGSKETMENIALVSLNRKSQIFKNLDLLFNAIDFLPKDLSKLFKDIKEFLIKKKSPELVEYIVKNYENYGLKSTLIPDKKSEKNFFYLQKYLSKEAIKPNKHDLKACYYHCLNLFLLDQSFFLLVPLEDKSLILLTKTLIEIVADPENKKILNTGLEALNKIINQENEQNEEYFTYLKELGGVVEILIKILKI